MAASYQSKRSRIGSDDKESECQKCSRIITESIACSGCKLKYCLNCAKVSEQLYNLIQSGDMDQFLWSCNSCRATFPSLENISSALNNLQKSNDVRIGKIEERVKQIEDSSKEEIKCSVASMKEEIIESLKGDLENLVDARTKELDDRRRRDCNLVLFNLPEHRSQNTEENKKGDEEDVKLLCSSLGLENVEFVAQFRLGRRNPTSSRPLKVILQNRAHRKYLLDNAKYIKEKAPHSLKRVIINKDLTLAQRQERKNRLATRRARVLADSELANNNNAGSQASIQEETVTMEVQEQFSPILPVSVLMSSTHLSQGNQFSDSQPTRNLSQVYEETTVIEKTIIGGLSQGNNLKEPTSPEIKDR